jgi:hypothetical protein
VRKGAYLDLTLQHPSTPSTNDTQRLAQDRLAGEHNGLHITVLSAAADAKQPDVSHVVAYVEGEQPAPENFDRLATSTLQALWTSAGAPSGAAELAVAHPQLLRISGWEGYDRAADAQAAPGAPSGGAVRPVALQATLAQESLAALGRGCIAPVTGGAPTAAPPLQAGAHRPTPQAGAFDGCPAGGDGNDQTQDALKNRSDTGTWRATTVGAILALPVPQGLPEHRGEWSDADRQAIAQYEGLPLQVTGYLAGSRVEGPESCNCHSPTDVDYHLWLVDAAGTGRNQSVVAEVTPRLRARHAGWTIEQICTLVNDQTQVRVSGWLMMDPAHPDEVGQTRGTTWEIHPILALEVNQNGRWVALDDVASGSMRRRTLRESVARLFGGS